jgi:hypothetical protein
MGAISSYICEALRKLYWQAAGWKMITHGTLNGHPAQMECTF